MNVFKKVLPQSSLGSLYVGVVAVCALLSVGAAVTDAVLTRVLDA